MKFRISDPKQVLEGFSVAETEKFDHIHTIVIDSSTFMMDMFESLYVLPFAGTKQGMTAWSNYAQFFKELMQVYVVNSTKNVIVLAHVESILNEEAMALEKKVPVKGALSKNGIEAFFSTVIAAKKVNVGKLDSYKSKLLNVTPEEEAIGVKYVFQTSLTKDTINERIRANMGMWDTQETFIDNDVQLLLDRLHEYYG